MRCSTVGGRDESSFRWGELVSEQFTYWVVWALFELLCVESLTFIACFNLVNIGLLDESGLPFLWLMASTSDISSAEPKRFPKQLFRSMIALIKAGSTFLYQVQLYHTHTRGRKSKVTSSFVKFCKHYRSSYITHCNCNKRFQQCWVCAESIADGHHVLPSYLFWAVSHFLGQHTRFIW